MELYCQSQKLQHQSCAVRHLGHLADLDSSKLVELSLYSMYLGRTHCLRVELLHELLDVGVVKKLFGRYMIGFALCEESADHNQDSSDKRVAYEFFDCSEIRKRDCVCDGFESSCDSLDFFFVWDLYSVCFWFERLDRRRFFGEGSNIDFFESV